MRLAQTLALSFDFGLQELMTTVLFGGTLCVPDRAERFAPQAYGTFLRRDRVTTLFATPTFVRGLVAQGVDLSGITLLVLGGEMLAPATVRAVLPLLAPQCRVINGYGPTEASINCTMHTVDLSRDERSAVLPVGSATGASRVYVLDARRQVLPVGLVGEVWVGGPGVADGYIDRPEETSARFVPDTVTGAGRMYRTGDLGRVVDGELVLLGRTDHQLKIRGYRVELGEVEAVLRASPGVEDAVVLVDRAGPSAALAAFVTGRPQPLPELRAALRRRLPAYMLPASVVHVPSLPRTAHGKLDERTLLALARQREGTGPPTEVQAGITRIWRDVLEVDDIHLDANFFELGGHSLVVATVADRLGKAFGLPPLPLPSVFEHPTVRLLADHVQSLLASAGSDASRPAPLATVRRVRGRQRGLSHGPSTAPPRSGP
jgi:acyl-CoA synthetase (AMP-forming)/AMP-acid ligase II